MDVATTLSKAGALEEATELPAAIGVGSILEQPHSFADGIEASDELIVGPCEDQASVLDAGDAEDAARLKGSFDLDEAVEWVGERLEYRVAKTGVEVIDRQVEGVHAANAELDILDLVLGRVALCVGEFLLARIDADDVTDRLRQTERDRPLSAPGIENAEIVVQVWKQKVGVVRRAPGFEGRGEGRAHAPLFAARLASRMWRNPMLRSLRGGSTR